MSISQRLYLLVGTALMSLLVLTAINHVQMNQVYEETNFSNINVVPSIEILNKVITEFGRLRVRVYRHALANPEDKAEIEKTIIDSQTLIDQS
jgi:methyl-accepting chemotaxis protein